MSMTSSRKVSLAERLIDLTEFKGYKGLAGRKENRPIDRCLTQLNEYEGVNGVNRLATKLGRENITDYRQNEEKVTDYIFFFPLRIVFYKNIEAEICEILRIF